MIVFAAAGTSGKSWPFTETSGKPWNACVKNDSQDRNSGLISKFVVISHVTNDLSPG